MKKLAVITGCDSGIGESLCGVLADNGYRVVMSYIHHHKFNNNPNVFAYKMDLKKEKDINSFVSNIKKHCKEGYSLSFMIHNAGIAYLCPIENIPLEKLRELFEINFFGLILLTQKIIPFLLESKGKIVIISSTAGRTGAPFMSSYCASKYAVEGFSDSLRRELSPFGIKTVIMQPGGITTPIWETAKNQDFSFVNQKYLHSIKTCIQKSQPGKSGLHPDDAAKKIFQIIIKKKNKSRYIIAKNRFMKFIPMVMSDSLLDRIFKKIYEMDYGIDKQ
jgi:short-subunit dehydrogenase